MMATLLLQLLNYFAFFLTMAWTSLFPRCFHIPLCLPLYYETISLFLRILNTFASTWHDTGPNNKSFLTFTLLQYWTHVHKSGILALWNLKGVMLQLFPLLQFLPFTKEPLCNCGSVYYFILLSKGIESSGWIMTHHLKIYDKICFQLYKPVGDN